MNRKFLKSVRQFFARVWRPAAVTIGLIVLVVLGAQFGLNEPSRDTGVAEANVAGADQDARGEITFEQYLRALDLEKEGKRPAARVEMRWLAPLGRTGSSREGIPEAHLWMANDLLDNFEAGFLSKFPLGAEDDSLTVAQITVDDSRKDEALRHLNRALELRPKYDEALVFRAALLISQSERERAIAGLIDGAAVSDDPSKLVFALIHALAYQGDDAALREQLWAGYSTLGNDIARSRRVEYGDRMRYALFALLRGDYEGFEISLNRMTKSMKDTEDTEDPLAALKIAPSYHQAVLQLVDSATFSASETAVHLGRCLDVSDGNQVAAAALVRLVEKYPSVKAEVSALINKDSHRVAMPLLDVVISPSGAVDQLDALKQVYLESASDPEALIRWAKASISVEKNDPEVLKQLQLYLKENRTVSSDEDVEIRTSLARHLMAYDDNISAIAVLEATLQKDLNTEEVRSLLAGAYRRLKLFDEAEMYDPTSGQ